MTIADFRRLALSLEGVEESSHMGSPDFRVGGRIFATLASAKEGFGNLKFTPEQQADFVREMPEVFIPVKGGWGKMGMTHILLAKVHRDVLEGALRAAWNLRRELNGGSKSPTPGRKKRPIKSASIKGQTGQGLSWTAEYPQGYQGARRARQLV